MHIGHINDALLLVRILSYSNNLHHNLNTVITPTMHVANNHNITIRCAQHIFLRETSSGIYHLSSHLIHLSSHLIANTLILLPYFLAVSILNSASIYFIVGLCMSLTSFTKFTLIMLSVILTANSHILFISSIAPNYLTGTSLVTISLAGFVLFTGYFLSKSSMPLYWLFMHYLSPYKYGLDALLANGYKCESWRCFELAEGAVCEVTERDVLEKRGLSAGER